MRWREAIVVSESGAAPGELLVALGDTGLRTVCLCQDDALRSAGARHEPLVMLLPASLGPGRVHGFLHALHGIGADCATLVYPDLDLAALDSCALAGIDYVAPPYRPALLRVRLEAQGPAAADSRRELAQAQRRARPAEAMAGLGQVAPGSAGLRRLLRLVPAGRRAPDLLRRGRRL
jgi:hypothetical protein